jgi:hypothetical protein
VHSVWECKQHQTLAGGMYPRAATSFAQLPFIRAFPEQVNAFRYNSN